MTTQTIHEVKPSHVAVLVPSVDKSAKYLEKFDFQIGPKEEFQETREIYVEYGKSNSLLLMEPNGPGSYQRALEKRGPGLHHLAIDVLDLNGFLKSISSSGWLLHLNSLDSMRDSKTAYLARPGFPALIEVQEKNKFHNDPFFVKQITLPLEAKYMQMIKTIGLENTVTANSKVTLNLGGRVIELKEIFI